MCNTNLQDKTRTVIINLGLPCVTQPYKTKQQLELNFMCWNLLAPPYNRGEETSQWLERIRNQIKQVSQKSPDIIGLQVFICTYITFVFSFIVFLGLPEI